MGAWYRASAIANTLRGSFPNTPMTLKAARLHREVELGRTFTVTEARDFNRGWHLGGANTLMTEIFSVLRYLNNDDVEIVNQELNGILLKATELLKRKGAT